MPDILISNHGTLFVLHPMTQAAKDWINEHVDFPEYMRVGQGVAVEHRMVEAIIDGAVDFGFDVR